MAIPKIMLQLAKSNPMMQQIKQMMNTVKMAQNPQAALNQMIASNPQMKKVMDVINQYGGDPNKALNSLAEQYGISTQDIFDMFN